MPEPRDPDLPDRMNVVAMPAHAPRAPEAPVDWHGAYAGLVRRLPGLAARAPVTLCGFSTCVDAYIRLEQAGPLLEADPATPAGRLARQLLERAWRGIGGEIHVDWPEGPAWLDASLPTRLGLGGTGAQAAQVLATLGAPTLVTVGDRSARQLERFHPRVGVALADRTVPVAAVAAGPGPGKPAHYIIEFAADSEVGGRVLPRSSRIICRFADDPLEHDPWFEGHSRRLAGQAGAAILSGYNEVPPDQLAAALAHTNELAAAWRAAGLRLIHLELGDFPDMAMAWQVMDGLRGPASSLGLSLSELEALLPDDRPVPERAVELAERMAVERVAVHYDTYALAVTRNDPHAELQALMAGSLLASTRAWHGEVRVPDQVPQGAVFQAPPCPPVGILGGWNLAACATPWLRRPAATIGLGDSFLAGTLLVLGQT
ncbi:MAG TPA: ADP-dependent glucokinase/phosphofructokinase [Geminicoccus sp.]|uniref:ADP-dependent glucokinase/phosphofructokinase n=1 Tax=Geminicoccus sp. TaxID=2024832 RepID=UPI002D1C7891|nr:ADP-dependent glucokinase/phosphofructokinase [Geminicoccus sp.]HWL67473.1 ADP-dependent glucokinase/phosphofructokinase [Geminicoccus sp.]